MKRATVWLMLIGLIAGLGWIQLRDHQAEAELRQQIKDREDAKRARWATMIKDSELIPEERSRVRPPKTSP